MPRKSEKESRAAARARAGKDRRVGGERRDPAAPPPGDGDRRLAERRTGLERRRPHLHYDALTPHPRPERNINDYPLSTDEVEFINAINDYKQKFDRPFPTWSEVLHILRTLGYLRDDAVPPPGVSPDAAFSPEGGPGGKGSGGAGGAAGA